MNLLNLFYLNSVLLVSCVSGTANFNTDSEVNVQNLVTEHQEDSCTIVTNEFPETYAEFIGKYGYDQKNGTGTNYANYEKEINFFFDCEGGEDSIKLNKCLQICTEAHWEADAVNLFLRRTKRLARKKIELFAHLLAERSNSETEMIWSFLFSTPHPEDKIIRQDYDFFMQSRNLTDIQKSILHEVYDKAISRSH